MKIIKRFEAISLALLMSIPMYTVTASAAEQQISVNAASETVYTQTADVQIETMSYASTNSKTVTANTSLGLALKCGQSGWGTPVTFRFTSLPSNALVRSIKIVPGSGVINDNNKNLLGAILISKIRVTSPSGTTADIAWKASGMTDNAYYLEEKGAGNWTALIYGTNLATPTGNSTLDLRFFGGISYKSAQMTITYVLQ